MQKNTITAGGAIFPRLNALGIDYVFVNSGTDFPPIIEGLADVTERGIKVPKALTIPHELVAVGMAHGHYLGSGKLQCVMLHTNVGLSNAASGVINAMCDRIPLLVLSGRTPALEQGRFGARTVPIGWGQEMRDQTAYVREVTKWDYELRFPEQICELLDRAQAIACSTPTGPVYLALPREVLCEEIDGPALGAPPSMCPVVSAASQGSIKTAAELLQSASKPLIVAQNGLGGDAAYAPFARFVEEWAFPVSQYWPIRMALPFAHPMCLGTQPTDLVATADVIVVIDSIAPWWPDRVQPKSGAKVLHIGPDPLYSRTPVRNFQADVSLAGETADTVLALIAEMGAPSSAQADAISSRREDITKRSSANLTEIRSVTQTQDPAGPPTKAYVAQRLTEVLAGEDHAVFSELGVPPGSFEASKPNSWFQEPPSGGLGWSFPAAMGYQLAQPDKLVVATMGDGSYMFANPTACHQVAEALQLPVVVMVLNNQGWGAVQASVSGLYPDGHAANTESMPLTALKPSPDFTLTAQASRAHTVRVEDSEGVMAGLQEAVSVAKEQRRTVLIEIAIQ